MFRTKQLAIIYYFTGCIMGVRGDSLSFYYIAQVPSTKSGQFCGATSVAVATFFL